MPNAIQILFIAFSIYLATKYMLYGLAVGTPSIAYFLAESLPVSFGVPLYLFSCFVFGAVLLTSMEPKNARPDKNRSG